MLVIYLTLWSNFGIVMKIMGNICCGKQEVIEAESVKSTSGSSHRNSSIILGRISKQQNYKT